MTAATLTVSLQVRVDARRSGDTEALAASLTPLVRQTLLVRDDDFDHTAVVPKKRGGVIVFRATIQTTRESAVAALRAFGAAIDNNASLIERVDGYQVATHADNGIIGFATGDFRGWVREIAIEDAMSAANERNPS